MKKIIEYRASFVACCLIMLAFSLLFASCGNNEFKVKGNVKGADKELVLLEKSDYLGNWVILDSTRTNSSGNFSFKMEAPALPEIYRLELGGTYVYFPIDSIETIELKGEFASLSKKYTLTGSEQAKKFAQFDNELTQAVDSKADLEKFKKTVFSKYMKDDRAGLLSYYILTKQVNGKMLYDAMDNEDSKYFAAVATAFSQYKPDDPRLKYLEHAALEGIRNRRKDTGKPSVVEANALNMIEISLPDVNGDYKSLSKEFKQGQATVVVFALMTHEDSPTFNRRLAEILTEKGGKVRFYQVSYDSDIHAWRDAAKNLPWTNVYDNNGMNSTVLAQYNVGNMPSFYIYSPSGELENKAETLDELSKKLAKY